MSQEIVFKEKYGAFGREKCCIKPDGQQGIVCVESSVSRTQSAIGSLLQLLRQVFLPQGYPDSVSDDYLSYQLWDTVQAFCSTVTGTLATRAVMTGIGVGSTDATPLAAAITWIFKDGTGMFGSICFAWWKGTSLDSNCKQWRLVADGLNDAAFFLELLLPFFRVWSTFILCLATIMKAVVGVAGGATRAAITQHQAIRGNMADVSAKDGSQERFVNLTASLAGIFILSTVPEGAFVWLMFILLTLTHLYANYCAVQSLTMTTLNSSRYNIILISYLDSYTVDLPKAVNRRESVIIGLGLSDKQLCGFKIILGASVSTLAAKKIVTYDKLKLLSNLFADEKYLLISDFETRTMNVVFKSKESPLDVIKAYFHAVMLALITDANSHSSPLMSEKDTLMKADLPGKICNVSNSTEVTSLSQQLIQKSIAEVNKRFPMFLNALHNSGWTTHNHHMEIDEWRGEWS